VRRLTALLVLACLAACGEAPPGRAAPLPTAEILRVTAGTQARVVPNTPVPPTAPPTALPATVVSSASATPVTPAPSPGAADDAGARERLLVERVNELRAANGLAAYAAEPALGEVARAHSCDLARHGRISHTSSNGRGLQERLAGNAGSFAWPSESIAAGTDDPAQVIALWMDEPPDGWHRRNLLDPDQQLVGVGYCAAPEDTTGNRHYWTMIVARRAP
jgi:uncharacterized protein YkwD